MISVVKSAALVGVEGHPVFVEVSLAKGLPSFTIVGLPDTAVREARERVRAAIVSSGFDWPKRRITVNLAPAGLPKTGSWYDLPIAIGILAGAGLLEVTLFDDLLVVGELALSGATAGVPGVLSAALSARSAGLRGVVVPAANGHQAAAVPDVTVLPVHRLSELRDGLPAPAVPDRRRAVSRSAFDLRDVVGQDTAKRGLEIAVAGGHHCLMVGEPGCGKTMLARRVPTILPPLGERECLEASLLHSLVDGGCGLLAERPFRSPHHTASSAAIVGGGHARIVPGELSLAHTGVLFLDELGEFRPSVLNVLRQPLESGVVQIARRSLRVSLPARVTLVAAANPCPCGYLGSTHRECECEAVSLRRYAHRLGGPLRDRLDLVIPVSRVDPDDLLAPSPGTGSEAAAERVVAARERQSTRNPEGRLNAEVAEAYLAELAPLDDAAIEFLRVAARHLTSRGLASVRRVARTVADMSGSDPVRLDDVVEAFGLRVRGGTPAASGVPA